jgi:hypothetical protein
MLMVVYAVVNHLLDVTIEASCLMNSKRRGVLSSFKMDDLDLDKQRKGCQ